MPFPSIKLSDLSIEYQDNTKALNLIFKDRAKSCTLDVRKSNLRAINVYNKLGFKEIYVRKAYYNDGEDDIVMKKEF